MDAHGEAAEILFWSGTGGGVTKDTLQRVEKAIAGGKRDLR
jgi:hypothetical protein